MPQEQMNDLTRALETFNNVSLPTLAFFFAVILLLVVGYLIRGLFGRDQRRDDLMGIALKSSTNNGEAITDLKKDIADALKGIRDDGAQSNEWHVEVIKALTTNVGTHADKVSKVYDTTQEIAKAINDINDAIGQINAVLPDLARKSEMDLTIGRLDEAITRLEAAKRDCLEKKRKTGELPPINLTPTLQQVITASEEETSKPEDAAALTPGANNEGKKAS